MPRPERRRGWTLLVMPSHAAAAPRTYNVRRWQMLALACTCVLSLLGTFAGGTMIGSRLGMDQLTAASVELTDAQLRAAALGDTLWALRIAAIAAPGASAAPATRPTRAAGSSLRPDPGVVLPLVGWISSGFSPSRRHPILKIRRPHKGVDIVAPAGTRITAPAAGRVQSVGRQLGTGLMVVLEHGNGTITRYAHLRSALVSEGARVESGTPIGTVGSSGLATGPHLHYEVLVHGRAVDPLRRALAPPAGVASAQAPPSSPEQGPAAPAGPVETRP